MMWMFLQQLLLEDIRIFSNKGNDKFREGGVEIQEHVTPNEAYTSNRKVVITVYFRTWKV